MNNQFSNLKVAHIVRDEKFPDSAYEQFEELAPGISDYYIVHNKKKIVHLRKIDPIRIGRFSFLNPFFLKKIKGYDAIILHGLGEFNRELVVRCYKKVNFLWIGMGYDYYDLLSCEDDGLLKPFTKEFSNKKKKKVGYFFAVKLFLKKILHKQSSAKIDDIEKIKWFSPVVASEYARLVNTYPKKIPEYLEWNYAVSAKVVDSEGEFPEVVGPDILIGNSAAITNNHIDIFASLRPLLEVRDCKIVVPLSYGDLSYREEVLKIGYSFFGDKFKPIVNFMPFSEYIDLLSSCSNVIMNHRRQQAGGIFAVALYMGARVFLDPGNCFYDEYRRHGVVINNLRDLEQNPGLIDMPLSPGEKKNNQRILKELRGWSQALRKTYAVLEKISRKRINL